MQVAACSGVAKVVAGEAAGARDGRPVKRKARMRKARMVAGDKVGVAREAGEAQVPAAHKAARAPVSDSAVAVRAGFKVEALADPLGGRAPTRRIGETNLARPLVDRSRDRAMLLAPLRNAVRGAAAAHAEAAISVTVLHGS